MINPDKFEALALEMWKATDNRHRAEEGLNDARAKLDAAYQRLSQAQEAFERYVYDSAKEA